VHCFCEFSAFVLSSCSALVMLYWPLIWKSHLSTSSLGATFTFSLWPLHGRGGLGSKGTRVDVTGTFSFFWLGGDLYLNSGPHICKA
jgi:hypothetical protein